MTEKSAKLALLRIIAPLYEKLTAYLAKKLTFATPGPGGYAAVIFRAGEMIEELSDGEVITTSKRMEITAAIVGLRAVREPSVITLYSDSQYLIKTLTQGWKRMKNVDLWARLDQAAKPHRVAWQWIRGHNGNPGNVRADALANQAARLHMAGP